MPTDKGLAHPGHLAISYVIRSHGNNQRHLNTMYPTNEDQEDRGYQTAQIPNPNTHTCLSMTILRTVAPEGSDESGKEVQSVKNNKS